jgi:hypothetical protein
VKYSCAAVQGTCDASSAVPAGTDAQLEFCLGDYSLWHRGIVEAPGAHFEACSPAAGNTNCADTRLQSASGSRVVPDECLETFGDPLVLKFPCSGAPAAGNKTVQCSVTKQVAECIAGTYCGDAGDLVCSHCLSYGLRGAAVVFLLHVFSSQARQAR